MVFFVIDNKVRTAVHNNFDDLAKSSPSVKSASFEGHEVDFFADEIKLHKVQVDLYLSKLPEFNNTKTDGIDLKGIGTQTVQTMTISGLREIVFGGNKISRIDADGIEFGAEMVQTITSPADAQQPSPLSTSMVMSGALPHAEIYGFDYSRLGQATKAMLLPYKVDRYEAKDIQIILAIKQTSQGLIDNLTGEPKKVAPLHADLSISRIIGTDVSNDYIGSVRYENTIANLSDPENLKEPVMLKMAEMSMTDTKMVDLMPLQSTLEIKGFEFDTSKMDSPKGKAMMAVLGIDQINVHIKTSYDFDPDQHTLSVSALRFGLKQAGSIDLNFALSGLPELDELRSLDDLQMALKQAPALSSSPEQAPEQSPEMVQAQAELKAMFKDLSIAQLALQYQDEGILKKFLGAQAMQLNAEPAQVAEAYAQQAAKIITATHGAEAAEKAQRVLIAFLTNPDALRVELKSTPPVNLQDLSEQIKVSGPMALQAFELNVLGGAEALSNSGR
ncbi:hypothetical protein [Magnetovibrio blakemorei]|uniref:hypothetical protein n=1 Tax=Magnetovibrio blakemorei TaxID=28181 RepID=UPI001112E4B8|nr:hypothetical protein [Magnetovibrio blakemorei]